MGSLSDAYCHQLMNPWDKSRLVRYPDHTMEPTALMSLSTRIRRLASGGDNTGQDLTTMLWVKCNASDPIYSEDSGTSFSAHNYGAQSAAYASSVAADRTLAAAMKLRITGLAAESNNEVPSGGAYLLRLTVVEKVALGFGTSVISEQTCMDLVNINKGFYVPFSQLIHMPDGVTIPYLPFGPNSFLFTDKQLSSGGAPTLGQDQVATTPGCLFILTFGGPKDMEFTIDYGHVIEYIPTVAASPIVSTAHQHHSPTAQNNIVKNVERLFTNLFGNASFKVQNNVNLSNMFNTATNNYTQRNSLSIGRYAGSVSRNTANYFESGIVKAAPEIAEAAIML